jgi:integrase/recombinase XerC
MNITPHSSRHAPAVHLVAAGVGITAIRSWLGHVSLDTANHHARANLETKRTALERAGVRSETGKLPRGRRDQSVLEWLDSL